jgi:hypothetical protein
MVEMSSEEQLLSKVLKMHRFCSVLFKCQGKCRKRIEEHPFYIRIFEYGSSLVEKLSSSKIGYILMKNISDKKREVAEFVGLICGSQGILTLIDSNLNVLKL